MYVRKVALMLALADAADAAMPSGDEDDFSGLTPCH
jgi:hypothetical protein